MLEKANGECGSGRVEGCEVLLGLYGERGVQRGGQLLPRPYGECVPEKTGKTRATVNVPEWLRSRGH